MTKTHGVLGRGLAGREVGGPIATGAARLTMRMARPSGAPAFDVPVWGEVVSGGTSRRVLIVAIFAGRGGARARTVRLTVLGTHADLGMVRSQLENGAARAR